MRNGISDIFVDEYALCATNKSEEKKLNSILCEG